MATSAIVIEEMTGGDDARTVTLTGPGLPFRPATMAVLQKVATTWYSGNTEGSQQVLGPQDPPVTWEGSWHRTMLGKHPVQVQQGGATGLLVSPFELMFLFDDITRKGRRLRVTWAALDGQNNDRGKVVREGRLTRCDWDMHRVDDIGWKMNFEWAGRGGVQNTVNLFSREGEVVASIVQMQQNANALATYGQYQRDKQASAQIPGSASPLSLGQIESLVDAPNNLLKSVTRSGQRIANQLAQVGAIVRKAKNVPYQLANTALALAKDTTAVMNQFHDVMSRRSPEQNTYKNNVTDLLRSTKHFWQATDLTHDLGMSGSELRARVATPAMRDRSKSAKSMLGTHVVKTGETTGTIARKWYGDADLFDLINYANHMPDHTVVPTRRVLVIPARDIVRQS
jgi:hypothetical protein